MQSVTASCLDAKNFPQNLGGRNPSHYNRSLYEQLNRHAERLFADEDEDECSLDFLELDSRRTGRRFLARKIANYKRLTSITVFSPTCLRTEAQVRTHLGLTTTWQYPDPQSRFL